MLGAKFKNNFETILHDLLFCIFPFYFRMNFKLSVNSTKTSIIVTHLTRFIKIDHHDRFGPDR